MKKRDFTLRTLPLAALMPGELLHEPKQAKTAAG